MEAKEGKRQLRAEAKVFVRSSSVAVSRKVAHEDIIMAIMALTLLDK